MEFLGKGIPGVNESMVKQQLANLKASGEYARIIAAVSGGGDALGARRINDPEGRHILIWLVS